MKIRITDLLDDYYDSSVKLTPVPAPDPIGSIGEPETDSGSRRTSALLIAATRLLVLTGGIFLNLRLSPRTQAGSALSEASSSFGISPEDSTLVPSPVPSAVQVTEIHPLSAQWSFVQRGRDVTFDLTLSMVPPYALPRNSDGTVVPEQTLLNIFSDSSGKPIDWVTLQAEAYDETTHELTVTGSYSVEPLTESFAGSMTFCVQVPSARARSEDDPIEVYRSHDITIPQAPEGAYTEGYSIDGTSVYTRIAPDLIVLYYPFYADVLGDPEAIDQAAQATAMNYLQELLYTKALDADGGSYSFRNLELGDVTVDLFPAEPTVFTGTAYAEIRYESEIDPAEIQSLKWPDIRWMDYDRDVSQSDTMLYAALDLSIPNPDTGEDWDGTLLRFDLDPDTGDFIWNATHARLSLEVMDAGGYAEAMQSEFFSDTLHAVLNTLQELYRPELEFSDGTRLSIGFGETTDYQNGIFTGSHNYYLEAEDQGVDVSGLLPETLWLNGTAYPLVDGLGYFANATDPADSG